MNIHTVTLPNGTEAKRTSTSRTYSHAVVAEYQNGTWKDWQTFEPTEGTTWTAVSWSSSEALARKAAQQVTGRNLLVVRVLPCQVVTKTPADKVIVRANRRGGVKVRAGGRDLGAVWNLTTGLTAAVYSQAVKNPDLAVPNVACGVAYILGSHGRPQAEIDQVLAKLEGGAK